jgi:hypothetical protein
MTDPFIDFGKMPRLSRGCTITEKIDGTNAQVFIPDDLSYLRAGSRNRWITPTDDNYGFAGWVERNRDELMLLGPGRHFGEWWGSGIQRRYGRAGQDTKTFSLFNAERWQATPPPACCSVVPVLYRGAFTDSAVDDTIAALASGGSIAAPGFMDPEGIIVFHHASRTMFKKTIKNDEKPKSLAA